MGAVGYFETGLDPFTKQKELGLSSAIDSIMELAVRTNEVFISSKTASSEKRLNHLQTFILTALWGNRMDLSLWPVGGNSSATEAASATPSNRASEAFASVLLAGQKMILSNHIEAVSDHVKAECPAQRMDIIVDNAGFELFCDLCLADFLVYSGLVTRVYLQLKAHPTFVSDAMAKDVHHTIDFLSASSAGAGEGQSSSGAAMASLGERWTSHISTGRWVLTEHFFWVQPQAMWDMPQDLKTELACSALVFVKGDANYRRLLGDLMWDFSTPFGQIVSYFATPLCALRTLKAELGCGMAPQVTQKVAQEEERWLVAGKYGVIQFCDTRSL